jgi:hypothetical protein
MIALTNLSGRIKSFDLPHETYCKARGDCACTLLPGKEQRRICASITIPAGKSLRNLPDAVLEVPAVRRAIKAGLLSVKKEKKAEPKAEKK